MTSDQIDIVIINVPGTLTKIPMSAPAILKANLEKNGFTCKTIDYNIEFYNRVSKDQIINLEKYFISPEYSYNQTAESLIDSFVDELIKLNSRFIGISVFTYQNQIATEIFCRKIKEKSAVKIVLGGQGLANAGLNGIMSFPEKLLASKLIDFYIRSEGEQSLVELLRANITYPGINQSDFQQIEDLNSLPYPNYDDYKFDLYEKKILPITGSRGCVRSCSFCDIHTHWKYKFRTGQNIAFEMINNYEKYKIKDFVFSDSLVNGSLKEFKVFCKIIAEYNKKTNANLTWGSQFIIRNSGQLDQEYWENLANSGARNLAIGVETGSDRVRNHMNKNFSNEDLDYNMIQFEKYGITCIFLMIIGYPTETNEDFQDTLNLFTRYKHLANRIILSVNAGSTLGILPNTPLYDNAILHNIELDFNENNWINYDNLNLTIKERIRRREEFCKHIDNLGFKLFSDVDPSFAMIKDKEEYLTKREKLRKLIKIKK